MGLRHGCHNGQVVPPGSLALDNNRAVQMLAALRRQINTLLLQRRQHARQHGSGGVHTGMMPDLPADDLAAGAADHKDVPCFQMCGSQQFLGGGARLCGNLRKFHRFLPLT